MCRSQLGDGQLVHTEVNTAAITNSEGQKKAGIRAYLSSSVEYDLPFEVTIDSEGIGDPLLVSCSLSRSETGSTSRI